MESIESLNMALEMYQGTLIFVSHDREFVSSLATRVIEITPERVVDFTGNYEDYLRSKGIENQSRWRLRLTRPTFCSSPRGRGLGEASGRTTSPTHSLQSHSQAACVFPRR